MRGRGAYVGKARNLRARVSNYARPSGHSVRIARMIRETASMMFLSTRTETDALLLEQNLIKQPSRATTCCCATTSRSPNILVTRNHPFPQIKKHRGAKSEKGDYYGPFASAGAVNRTLNQLQRVFLLRSCTDSTFASRTRPCLLYQIKRCSAPCVGRISEADYAGLVADAERFLQGRSTSIQTRLAVEMAEASEAMEYERAAALRDRIKALTAVQSVQAINPKGVPEADVVALHLDAGQACVQVFFIRGNQSWGTAISTPHRRFRIPGRDHAGVSGAVLRRQAAAAADPAERCGRGCGFDGAAVVRPRRAAGGVGVPQRGEGRAGGQRAAQRPRKPPAGWRKAPPSGGYLKVWPRHSNCRWCRGGSRSRQQPYQARPRSAA